MGEISDSIIAGEICALCMTSFDNDAGYPVVCGDCYEPNCGYQLHPDEKTSKKLHHHKGLEPTKGKAAIKGVTNFLMKKGLDKDDLSVVLRNYATNIMDDKDLDEGSICEFIQRDFGKFVKWFKKTYKK